MTHIPPTPSETLMRARRLGLRAGLRFVYTDDIANPDTADTMCPDCGTCIIERKSQRVHIQALSKNGTCTNCGTQLAIITARSSRLYAEEA